jgi:hypothetical protein
MNHRILNSLFLPAGPPARAAAFAAVAALGLCVAGCHSVPSNPAPDTQTSITLTNRSGAQIDQAVRTVFTAHGFQGGPSAPNAYTYQRLGSRQNNLAYGDFMFDELVSIRVVLTLQQLDALSTRLSCSAWMVEGADDPVFEDQQPPRKIRKWPYQELLGEIRGQLGE